MEYEPWAWIGFTAAVVGILLADLLLFHGRPHEVSLREALGWTIAWASVALEFGIALVVWRGTDSPCHRKGRTSTPSATLSSGPAPGGAGNVGLSGRRWLVCERARWRATTLLVVLVMIEGTDLFFAVDSILAILAVTDDAFTPYTANVLAMLGLARAVLCPRRRDRTVPVPALWARGAPATVPLLAPLAITICLILDASGMPLRQPPPSSAHRMSRGMAGAPSGPGIGHESSGMAFS